MGPIIIVGAGGHAKVIIDIFEESGQIEIAGCTSVESGQREILGIPILGGDDVLPSYYGAGLRHAFVALGSNRARQKKSRELAAMGFTLVRAVSQRAAVSRHTTLGCGVAVMPGVVINAASQIEDGVIVNTGATVDHDCRLGAFCHVCPGVNLAGCVTVGEGALLGAGGCVIPGVSIGAWSIVGAGAAVISDIAGGVTAVGVPAAIINFENKPR